jgi:hypothetical protein
MVREDETGGKEEPEMGNHLVLALARLEVQIRDIHFLQAKGTLFRFLFEVDVRLVERGWSWT